MGAFRYEQVGVRGQEHGVVADARVRAVGDGLAVQIEAKAHTGRGVHQETAIQGEGQLVGPGRQLADLHRVGQLVQGDGEGLVDNGIQGRFCALLAEDSQVGEAEFAEDVQPLDVVQVEVAEEEIDGQIVLDVAVRFVKAVSGVQDDVVLFRVDEGTDGVAGGAVVPAVGAQKDDLHANSPLWMAARLRAVGGPYRPGGFRSARRSEGLRLRWILLLLAGRSCTEPGSWRREPRPLPGGIPSF